MRFEAENIIPEEKRYLGGSSLHQASTEEIYSLCEMLGDRLGEGRYNNGGAMLEYLIGYSLNMFCNEVFGIRINIIINHNKKIFK